MTTDNAKGIVYVLINPAMPGLVKIGKTTRDDVHQRMQELFSTGVPVPFKCHYACKVDVNLCDKIEKALHNAFGPDRVNPNREFFQIDPARATEILKLFDSEGATDITEEVEQEINNDLTAADRDAGERLKIKRRPPLNFKDMGIGEHSILTFTDNENVTVEVISEKKIKYNGQEMSLTAVTRELKNLDFNVQPTKYWIFEGKNLSDIYDETYPFEEA